MKLFTGTLLLAVFAGSTAQANPITFNFRFDGAAYAPANTAVASGSITFDDTKLANPGRNLYDPGNLYSAYGTAIAGLVTALNVTVSGASAGNGTFGLADFDAVLFDTSASALDFSRQLVGQATASPNGKLWGEIDIELGSSPPQSYTGDFQLFSKTGSDAPYGIYPFQIGSAEGNGDGLQLVSFTQVPEPGSLWLFGGAGLGWWGSRRKRAQA